MQAMGQQGFWDVEDRQQKLKQKEGGLESVESTGAVESFRLLLMRIHEKPRKSQAGRNPTDVLLLFKMLMLQKLYRTHLRSLSRCG
jgi:IS5 family transposase